MAAGPVVVGVDGSEESLHAVEWAALEARRHRAPLRIVSAPGIPPPTRAYDASPQTVVNALRSAAAWALEAAISRAEEVAPRLLIDTELLAGPPAVAVAGSGSGALLLVVGARGAGGFAAMLLGSVSRYAAAHAACPVVAVRDEMAAVHREVAVGVRDPDDATGALGFAFEEAAARTAGLVVVHAWHRLPSPLTGSGEADRVAAQVGRGLALALAGWREKYPGVAVRQDVMPGYPARVLACYSARADLVVIGRHGGPGKGPAVASVQHALLNHARGPVAIVPAAR